MDSLTEKIDQLLVWNRPLRALEVCESEGNWRENTKIQSFQFYPPFTVALFPFSASVIHQSGSATKRLGATC